MTFLALKEKQNGNIKILKKINEILNKKKLRGFGEEDMKSQI